jgi:hypothetical protein
VTSGASGLLTAIPIQLSFGSIFDLSQAYQLAAQGFSVGLYGPFQNGLFPALNFITSITVNQFVQFILFTLDLIMGVAITNAIAGLLGGKLTLGIGKFKLA